MNRYQLPGRVVMLTKQPQGGFITQTKFDNGRIVDGVCVHDYEPCDCDRRTEERLLEEFHKAMATEVTRIGTFLRWRGAR